MSIHHLKAKLWIGLFFLCFLICMIFALDSLHYGFAKKKTWAEIESIQKKEKNKYNLKLKYFNGEDTIQVKKRIQNKTYQRIGKDTGVQIFYRNLFSSEVILVDGSPNFFGQAFILFVTAGLFFIGFSMSCKNLKS
ncbi:hypothetical protein [Flagellimonas oceanensis]|uniref:hypothetical protein n=1 Tax=Flagellimonas oceanensis TaxID=2499163 RepID=UPI000F8E6B32|nr:hypothetical protein [Allomuricauda oceanensis]